MPLISIAKRRGRGRRPGIPGTGSAGHPPRRTVSPVRFGLIGLALAAAAPAGSVEPAPAWHRPSFARRLLFDPGPLGTGPVLVRLPAGTDFNPGDSHLAATDGNGRPLPVEIIRDNGMTAFRVDVSGGGEGLHAVYLRPDDPQEQGEPPLVPPASPAFRAEVYRHQVDTVPNTRERLLFMIANARSATPPRFAPPGEAIQLPSGRRGQARGQGHGVRLETIIRVPTEGAYRFALRAPHPAWLAVGGQAAAETAAVSPADEPSPPGPPVHLPAGFHRVEVLAAPRADAPVHLFWQPPGHDRMEPLPDALWIAATDSARVRWEQRDRTLYPDFTFEPLRTYRFRGRHHRFYEVEFRDATANWIATGMRRAWQFGDHAPGDDGEAPVHRFSAPGEQRIRLAVRDDLGFEATADRVIDLPPAPAVVYDLHAVLLNIPAVAYPDDPVRPTLRVSARVPGDLVFDLRWVRVLADGREEEGAEQVRFSDHSIERVLGDGPAGQYRAFRWTLAHDGRTLLEGACRVERPPFERMPHRAEATRLYDAEGQQLVLLPHRMRDRVAQPPITLAQAFGRMLFLDDVLLDAEARDGMVDVRVDRELARIVNGPDHPVLHTEIPAPWSENPGVFGPLTMLAEAEPLIDRVAPDVLVLSLGMRDIRAGLDAAGFERRAAALSDLASQTRGVRVIWVTPPPYGDDPAGLRAYAQAIRRVADARSIPVADLYSAFLADPGSDTPFLHRTRPALTAAGHARAAQLLARALLAEAREDPR